MEFAALQDAAAVTQQHVGPVKQATPFQTANAYPALQVVHLA